ncbi:MAG: hypothetical protein MJ064_05570 [Lachnospiraceae bacterium]|nr:hypothetical protein [Lachnospiraceae bacterium]
MRFSNYPITRAAVTDSPFFSSFTGIETGAAVIVKENTRYELYCCS